MFILYNIVSTSERIIVTCNNQSGGSLFWCEHAFFFENRQNYKILQNPAERGFAKAFLVIARLSSYQVELV